MSKLDYIHLDQINWDESPPTRAVIDEETVERYVLEMQAGDNFPEVDLFFDGIYRIGDGQHRIKATERAGLVMMIPANVHEGGYDECLAFAIQANRQHGLPRSRADVTVLVQGYLRRYPDNQDSSRVLAEKIGCSHTLVQQVRRELEGDVPEESVQVVEGRDGRKQPRRKRPLPQGKMEIGPEKRKAVRAAYQGLLKHLMAVDEWRELTESHMEAIAEAMAPHWDRKKDS